MIIGRVAMPFAVVTRMRGVSARIRTPSRSRYEFGIDTPLAPVSIRNGIDTESSTRASTRISGPSFVNGISISPRGDRCAGAAAGCSFGEPE
jgi:hypothetical protein